MTAHERAWGVGKLDGERLNDHGCQPPRILDRMTTKQAPPPLLDLTQAAERLGIPRTLLARNWQAWGVKSVRLGHRTLRFRARDIDALAARLARQAA